MITFLDQLIKERLVTSEQLADARIKQVGAKKPIHELLVEMGFISEEKLLNVLSHFYNIPLSNLATETIDPKAISLIPYNLVELHGVFPVRQEADAIILAMSNPYDVMAIDAIRSQTNLQIKPILCSKSDIGKAVNKYYQTDDSLYDILKNVSGEIPFEIINDQETGRLAISDRFIKDEISPVIRLYNLILKDALKSRVTDIHIEPEEKTVRVRYRVDGELRNIMEVPLNLQAELTVRIKIIAAMDIAEKRKPQDGRMKLLYQNRKIDLRIATIPIAYGEKIEIRILDPNLLVVELDTLGMDPKNLALYKKCIVKPQGMVLITGPTGSGKTTTLYATLKYIKSEKKNIVTVEDPIEYLIEGVNQTQINPAAGLDFSSYLRSIMRHDPNVILIGEIRDRETADIAFRAALTGHLIFSTLHTNNAVGAIARLLNLGLEPYLIASSLVVVIAQRLVKKICSECKEVYQPGKEEVEKFSAYLEEGDIKTYFKGRGCEACGYTGFLGRLTVLEFLEITESVRTLIARNAPEEEIVIAAKREGFKPLSSIAIELIASGVTTLDEVARVILLEETEASHVAVRRGEKVKLLVVEDEEDISKTLEKRLVTAGYDVVKARDGIEALEVAFKEKPDLIITDVTMPKMDGFELTKHLRSRLETAVIPIVMLTARQDKPSELKGIDVGADDYITKPFDFDKLLSRIKMLLRRK
ncbi:MAG: type II/IV secretion system protein [Candidatus Omnitrophota bacterium]